MVPFSAICDCIGCMLKPVQCTSGTLVPIGTQVYPVCTYFDWTGQFKYTVNHGRASGLGCLCRDVFRALFSCWCPHFSIPPTQQMNAKRSELSHLPDVQKKPTLTLHKRVVRGQRLISLEKKMSNVVFKNVTNVLLICDPFVTHLRPIYDPSITIPWFIWDPYVTTFDPHVTHVWPSVMQPVTHMWFIFDLSVTYPVTHVSLIWHQSVTHPVTNFKNNFAQFLREFYAIFRRIPLSF